MFLIMREKERKKKCNLMGMYVSCMCHYTNSCTCVYFNFNFIKNIAVDQEPKEFSFLHLLTHTNTCLSINYSVIKLKRIFLLKEVKVVKYNTSYTLWDRFLLSLPKKKQVILRGIRLLFLLVTEVSIVWLNQRS